jgi:hypothetical protein
MRIGVSLSRDIFRERETRERERETRERERETRDEDERKTIDEGDDAGNERYRMAKRVTFYGYETTRETSRRYFILDETDGAETTGEYFRGAFAVRTSSKERADEMVVVAKTVGEISLGLVLDGGRGGVPIEGVRLDGGTRVVVVVADVVVVVV